MRKQEISEKQELSNGNGNAVFISYGTDDEYEDFVEKEDRGWGKFINKILHL